MHKPRHSLAVLTALLGGKRVDDAYRPKVPGLPVWVGVKRSSTKGGTVVHNNGTLVKNPTAGMISRRDWRASTKAIRRRKKDAQQRAARAVPNA